MIKVLLMASIFTFLSMANAESLKDLNGLWGFNHYEGKNAKCTQVADKLLKQSAKSNVKCNEKPSAGSYDQAGGKWFQCKGSKFSWNIYESKAICSSNLEMMLMNGD